MEHTPQSKSGLGEKVSRARLYASLTIPDLAKHTKISERYLVALESEDWASLPADVFLRGYIKILAKALETNQSDWLHLIPNSNTEKSEPLNVGDESSLAVGSRWHFRNSFVWLGISVLTLCVLVYILKTNILSEPQFIADKSNVIEKAIPEIIEPVIRNGESFASLPMQIKPSLEDSAPAVKTPSIAVLSVENKDVKLAVSQNTVIWIKADKGDWVKKNVDPGLYEIVFDRQVMLKLTDVRNSKVLVDGKPSASSAQEFNISLKLQGSGIKL